MTLYNVQLRYVSPENLSMPEHVMSYVAERGIHQKKIHKLEDAIIDTDILYMTRIQKERFASEEEYKKVFFKKYFKNVLHMIFYYLI